MNEPLELRCFCRKRPLLAVCGYDRESGQPFIHIKTFKQQRLFVEVVITSGVARIHCRECLKWQTVTIVRGERVRMRPEALPATISI